MQGNDNRFHIQPEAITNCHLATGAIKPDPYTDALWEAVMPEVERRIRVEKRPFGRLWLAVEDWLHYGRYGCTYRERIISQVTQDFAEKQG